MPFKPIQLIRIPLHHPHPLRHILRLVVNLAHPAGVMCELHLDRVGEPEYGLIEDRGGHMPEVVRRHLSAPEPIERIAARTVFSNIGRSTERSDGKTNSVLTP